MIDLSDGVSIRRRWEYAYDALGQQTLIRDPIGTKSATVGDRETVFTYDDQGRQTSRTLPEGITETFTYDAHGRLTTHVSFEVVVTARHDLDAPAPGGGLPTGRLTAKRFFASVSDYDASMADPVANPPPEALTVTHDAFGREASVEPWRMPRGGADALGAAVRPTRGFRLTAATHGARTSTITSDLHVPVERAD